MLKVFILDDEEESINGLRLKLEKHCKYVQILGSSTDSETAVNDLQEMPVDLLFLDVEMPQMDGFEVLENLKYRDFEVIMVTAFSDYAIKAIKASAIDYLLKPVDIKELKSALEKVIRKRTENQKVVSQLENIVSGSKPKIFKIPLNSARETYYVAPEEIIHIAGESNYSTFHLTDGKKIVVSKTLKEFEDILFKYHFFRVHKSHLINLAYLKKINKGIEFSITMKNDSELEVSSRKKADFLKILDEFLSL